MPRGRRPRADLPQAEKKLREWSRDLVVNLGRSLQATSREAALDVGGVAGDQPLARLVAGLLPTEAVGRDTEKWMRTFQRWCQGRPPDGAALEALLKPLQSSGRITAEAARKLQRQSDKCRMFSDQLQLHRQVSVPQLLGMPADQVERYIEWFDGRNRKLRERCAVTPFAARIESALEGAPVISTATDDATGRLVQILDDEADFPIRILIEADSGSGKSLLTSEIVGRLLGEYRGERHDPPFPIFVDWRRWIAEIYEDSLREASADLLGRIRDLLFQVVGPPLPGGGDEGFRWQWMPRNAAEALRAADLVVVADGIDSSWQQQLSEPSRAALTECVRSIGRLICSGTDLRALREALTGSLAMTFEVRLQRLDVRQTAEMCRQEILRNDARYGDLAGLGESTNLLCLPGVAGRLLAHLRAGTIGVRALSSDCLALSALYAADVCRRHGLDSAQIVAIGKSPPTDDKVEDPPLVLDDWGPTDPSRIDHILRSRVELDSALPDQRKSSFLASSEGEWLFSRMPSALHLLQMYQQRCTLPDDGLVQCEVKVGGTRRKCLQIPEFLIRLDAGAVDALYGRVKDWSKTEWRQFAIDMLDVLQSNGVPHGVEWSNLRHIWHAFVTVLPLVRNTEKELTRELCSALGRLFDGPVDNNKRCTKDGKRGSHHNGPQADGRDDVPGQTTFRWYGARAAAYLMDESAVCDELRSWNPEKHNASNLIFLAEVAGNLRTHVPSTRGERHEQSKARHTLAAELRTLLARVLRADDDSGIRHARYHLWESLVRVASPEQSRIALATLLEESSLTRGPFPRPGFRAVECALAFGLLHSLGAVRLKLRDPIMRTGLVHEVIKEVKDKELWGDRSESSWYQIHAHMFPAFRYAAPLLTHKMRQNVLHSFQRWFEPNCAGKIAMETGYLSWMLDWLEQESLAGISLEGELIENVLWPLREKLDQTINDELERSETVIQESAILSAPDAINLRRLKQLTAIHGRRDES